MKDLKPTLYEVGRMLLKYNEVIETELGRVLTVDIIFRALCYGPITYAASSNNITKKELYIPVFIDHRDSDQRRLIFPSK